MSKHSRAKLYLVYLTPWTLFEKLATQDVQFPGTVTVPTADSTGTVREVWRAYLNKVWPHSLRTIRNFMANSWAESHKDDEDDEGQQGTALSCAMTLVDVEKVLAGERASKSASVKTATGSMKSVEHSTEVAMRISHMQDMTRNFNTARCESIMDRHDRLKKSGAASNATTSEQEGAQPVAADGLGIVRRDWSVIEAAYKTWHHEVYLDHNTATPTSQQARVLDMVHKRCMYEHFLEQKLPLPPELQELSCVPLYRLIHGLPGSGKSRVLLWLRSYFEDVWQWTHGDQFVFLAPLNSMSDNIRGFTLHSFFAMTFTDRRGTTINSAPHDKTLATLLSKLSLLVFVFIDEVEAVGADLLGRAEEACRQHSRRPGNFRYTESTDAQIAALPRPFGGFICYA